MQPSSISFDDLPLKLQQRVDLAARRFERAFLANPDVRLEAYCLDATANERGPILLELLLVELECRRASGEKPTLAEYLERLPRDADVVRTAFRPAPDSLAGYRLGKYQLTSLLGRGGMGFVYAAEDTVVGRQVAIKVLAQPATLDSSNRNEALQEARNIGQLLHPNIVTLFEADVVDGVVYMAFELISGGSAADRLNGHGPFDWLAATRIAADGCRALVAAHAAGFIHRDIKPANLLLTAAGSGTSGQCTVAKLTDFGLACHTSMNSDGQMAGTPSYMAPEQAFERVADVRSDVYGLGATYFALLTGQSPIDAKTYADLLAAHREDAVLDPKQRNPSVPDACATIVRRAMAKSPEDRYASAADFLAALETLIARHDGVSKLRPRRNDFVFASLLAMLLIAVVGWGFSRRDFSDATNSQSNSAQTPGPWRPLWNGVDFSGWTTKNSNGIPSRNSTDTFQIQRDAAGSAMVVTGDRTLYVVTDEDFENYHLHVVYSWKQEAPSLPNSGIYYHYRQTPDGSICGHEFDLYPPKSGSYYRASRSTQIDIGSFQNGKIKSVGLAGNMAFPRRDYECPSGERNELDLVCFGDSSLHVLNGKTVLALTHSRMIEGDSAKPLTRGRLLIQSTASSKGARLLIHEIKIRDIHAFPPEFAPIEGD